jgi:hypothetical protein
LLGFLLIVGESVCNKSRLLGCKLTDGTFMGIKESVEGYVDDASNIVLGSMLKVGVSVCITTQFLLGLKLVVGNSVFLVVFGFLLTGGRSFFVFSAFALKGIKLTVGGLVFIVVTVSD